MITITNLLKKYDGKIALDGISFSIPDHSVYAIVGPNGAGKSTLLKILTNILDYDEGIIDYGSLINETDFRQNIAYLPEQRGLYSGIDIETQLMFFAGIRGLDSLSVRKNVKYWLKKFDVENWKHRHVSELSKGMQQKVQLISCLVSNPKFLFLDEPFSGIDPINFRLFVEILQEYQKMTGTLIVLSTHNMKSVEDFCTDVVLLNHGRIEIAGNVSEVKQSYTKDNLLILDTKMDSGNDGIDKIQNKLGSAFKIVSYNKEHGHLYLELKDMVHSAYSESMRQVLSLLDDIEIYECSRKTMSMEDIFIQLGKK